MNDDDRLTASKIMEAAALLSANEVPLINRFLILPTARCRRRNFRRRSWRIQRKLARNSANWISGQFTAMAFAYSGFDLRTHSIGSSPIP